MSWKLLVKSSAESDILDGFVDFEERLDGLGKRFLDEVENSFNRIELNQIHNYIRKLK
ncbi:MAG: hypothetical protein ACI9ZT_000704 [Gammaproteobacteria bacterium]|jgi:hypothetical protein